MQCAWFIPGASRIGMAQRVRVMPDRKSPELHALGRGPRSNPDLGFVDQAGIHGFDTNGPDTDFGLTLQQPASLMAVAVIVEAMASFRPHRPGVEIDAVLGPIECEVSVQLDGNAVRSCGSIFLDKH